VRHAHTPGDQRPDVYRRKPHRRRRIYHYSGRDRAGAGNRHKPDKRMGHCPRDPHSGLFQRPWRRRKIPLHHRLRQ